MPAFEGRVRDDPADPNHHAELGLLYAYMHRKEDAIRESRRAVELEPESQNAFHGALVAGNLALVYALVGEQDQAITLIERLLSTPGPIQWLDFPQNITLAELRLRWEWDSLRSNPRFQKILAGPEPKTVLTNSIKLRKPKVTNRHLSGISSVGAISGDRRSVPRAESRACAGRNRAANKRGRRRRRPGCDRPASPPA